MTLTVLFCVFQGCSFISVKAPWGHIRLFVKGGGEDFIFVQNYKWFVNFEILLLTDKNEVFPQCKHHFSQPYDIFSPSLEGIIIIVKSSIPSYHQSSKQSELVSWKNLLGRSRLIPILHCVGGTIEILNSSQRSRGFLVIFPLHYGL